MTQPIELPPHSRIAIPTKSLMQGASYVDVASTDIRATFARARAEAAKPARGLRAVTKR